MAFRAQGFPGLTYLHCCRVGLASLGAPECWGILSSSLSPLLLSLSWCFAAGKEKQTHHSLPQIQLFTEILMNSLKLQKGEDTNLQKRFHTVSPFHSWCRTAWNSLNISKEAETLMKIRSCCDQIHPHAVGDKGSHPQGWSFGGNIHYITGKVGVAGRRALLHCKPGGFGQISPEKNKMK